MHSSANIIFLASLTFMETGLKSMGSFVKYLIRLIHLIRPCKARSTVLSLDATALANACSRRTAVGIIADTHAAARIFLVGHASLLCCPKCYCLGVQRPNRCPDRCKALHLVRLACACNSVLGSLITLPAPVLIKGYAAPLRLPQVGWCVWIDSVVRLRPFNLPGVMTSVTNIGSMLGTFGILLRHMKHVWHTFSSHRRVRSCFSQVAWRSMSSSDDMHTCLLPSVCFPNQAAQQQHGSIKSPNPWTTTRKCLLAVLAPSLLCASLRSKQYC